MMVGITGHQDLGSAEDVAWVTRELRAIVARPDLTSGVMSLAVGADQLFAALLSEQGKPFIVVQPCLQYESTFQRTEDLASYRALLDTASRVVVMPFVEPSEEAFWEAGKYVVDTSDYIVAVWNGQPARGLGGTGDVVRYCLEQGKTVMHINLITRSTELLR